MVQTMKSTNSKKTKTLGAIVLSLVLSGLLAKAETAQTMSVPVKTSLVYFMDRECVWEANGWKGDVLNCYVFDREVGSLKGSLTTHEDGSSASLVIDKKSYPIVLKSFLTMKDTGPFALSRTKRPNLSFTLSPDVVKDLMSRIIENGGNTLALTKFDPLPIDLKWVTKKALREKLERYTSYDSQGEYEFSASFTREWDWFHWKTQDNTLTRIPFGDDPGRFEDHFEFVMDVGNKVKVD
ncbi:hypothetical protein WDW86_09740 [Bdellovibrionota bacterium FG-2]